jgi:hypothetical protein
MFSFMFVPFSKKSMKWLLPAMIIGVVLSHRAVGQANISFDNFAPGLAPVTINALPVASNPADGPAGAYVGSNYTASLFFCEWYGDQ